MRPGQLTPENLLSGGDHLSSGVASMRPGQLTPENLHIFRSLFPRLLGFNEAGAINPGKPYWNMKKKKKK